MEIIHITPEGDYEHYEALTLQKEQLEKDAEMYYHAYIREFGDLITDSFQLKIDCIALKKEIALYIGAKNSGKKISENDIKEYLRQQMTAYNTELERMLREKKELENAVPISEYDCIQIKTIYRRLAKVLHPDISPLAEKYPQLNELFARVTLAYKCNDLKELQKAEVLINKALTENGIDNFSMVIPDISERIEELEKDIDRIVNSIPYTYKELIEDKSAAEEKQKELEAEKQLYTDYKSELEATLKEIKEENSNG